MLPVETLETVLFFLTRDALEAAQLASRHLRDVIATEAFASRAALRLISRLRLGSDSAFATVREVHREKQVQNGDDLLRRARFTCFESLYMDVRLHSALDWYLAHRSQLVAINISVWLPFASDERHRSFFHEASVVSWSGFSVENLEQESRTNIPLMSSSLRSCVEINLRPGTLRPYAIEVSFKDVFDWIVQTCGTSPQRRFVSLSRDSFEFADRDNGLISLLNALREDFRHVPVANSYEITFRELPAGVLSRKDEFEHRMCNRHTMEYFEIYVTCPTTFPAVFARRRPLF